LSAFDVQPPAHNDAKSAAAPTDSAANSRDIDTINSPLLTSL
jgi:hypothetical protein